MASVTRPRVSHFFTQHLSYGLSHLVLEAFASAIRVREIVGIGANAQGFEAGADGILVSREYDENRASNLRAVGRAVRQLSAQNQKGKDLSS